MVNKLDPHICCLVRHKDFINGTKHLMRKKRTTNEPSYTTLGILTSIGVAVAVERIEVRAGVALFVRTMIVLTVAAAQFEF